MGFVCGRLAASAMALNADARACRLLHSAPTQSTGTEGRRNGLGKGGAHCLDRILERLFNLPAHSYGGTRPASVQPGLPAIAWHGTQALCMGCVTFFYFGDHKRDHVDSHARGHRAMVCGQATCGGCVGHRSCTMRNYPGQAKSQRRTSDCIGAGDAHPCADLAVSLCAVAGIGQAAPGFFLECKPRPITGTQRKQKRPYASFTPTRSSNTSFPPSQPAIDTSSSPRNDKPSPHGNMASIGSERRMNQFRKATDNSITATTKWLQAAARRLIERMMSISAAPIRPATTPMKTPPPSNHSDKRAQNSSAVNIKARSVARAVMRKAMGNGTTMGCRGWLPRAIAVCGFSDWRRQNAFMNVILLPANWERKQAAYHAHEQKSWLRRALAVPVVFLAGCEGAPLSALDPASAQAQHIANVWHVMAWGSLSILLMMLALVFFALRARSEGRPGRRPLWLLLGGGVLFPLSVMSALLAYAYLGAPAQQDAEYRVQVTAHQWQWEVIYPDAPGGPRASVNILHVPAGQPVSIELTASDVIHGFWVPRLGGKMDAIPGRTNHVVYTADEPGIYHGQCAEYCGIGHAAMHFQVVAHEEDELAETLATLPTLPSRAP